MCQHIPVLTVQQISHIVMVGSCTVLEQNDTMLKQFCLLMANSQPKLILQEYAVILAIDRCTNWHGMVMHKSTSAVEHEVHNLQCYRGVVAIICMALWSSLSMCGIHFTQTFCFPKLLVGMVNTCWRNSIFYSNCLA